MRRPTGGIMVGWALFACVSAVCADVVMETVPVVNEEARLIAPAVNVVGLDPERMDGFPDVVGLGGRPLDVGALGDEQVYINESAADELAAGVGDTVTLYHENNPFPFQIADVVQDRLMTGQLDPEDTQGMVARLDIIQRTFGREAEVDISVDGKPIEIAFNARYLIDMLSVIDSEQMVIETSTPQSPGVLKPVDQDDFVCVIMPMHFSK